MCPRIVGRVFNGQIGLEHRVPYSYPITIRGYGSITGPQRYANELQAVMHTQ